LTVPPSSGNTGQLWVCPTSHLDWDWLDTFAEYFEIGPPSSAIPDPGYISSARKILEGVCQLLRTQPGFCYSLAEVDYLRAYLAVNPDDLATLIWAGPGGFALMGGGITSPDNLVCHGEVFIRNYLLGRRYLASVGLGANVVSVAWLPDDFGHDPQLPVVLEAMGLQWLGLSRIPGSPQPFPNQPTTPGMQSLADQLNANGLVFPWFASDGSQVLTHFMPSTYGAVWDGADTDGLATFVEKHNTAWPIVNGLSNLFAPVGGDFALSQWDGGDWEAILNTYNGPKPALVAKFGTFAQFMTEVAGSAGPACSPLKAQNYWTGIFASRPLLKTLHHRAAQLTLAAEAAATLLRLTSTYSTTTLDDLDSAIEQAWAALVPSSHHDYITGTSPDRVYWSEQLPMLELAARLGEQCLAQAAGLIAAGVTAGPAPSGDTPVVVFNPVGFARGGVVELPARAVPGSVSGVSFGSAGLALAQSTHDGGLLFAVPDTVQVDSFGYTTAILLAGTEPAQRKPPPSSDVVILQNTELVAEIDPQQGWAITRLLCQGSSLLDNGPGNSIRVYRDDGNIYQFGNEPLQQGDWKTFADSGTLLTAGPGKWVEYGPVLQHYQAMLTGTYGNQPVSYTLDYLLYVGEPILRMRVTGAAPAQTTVVTTFDLPAPAPGESNGLTYGTACHFDDNEPTPYWPGPTFRATHDFVQTTGTAESGLAIFHQGVPAWSVSNGQLLGALMRNNFGIAGYQRGASGTDPGVHTQQYAIGAAAGHLVVTGGALRTALTVTNPLVAAVADPDRPTYSELGLPQQAGLAAITSTWPSGEPVGILRAARTQAGGSAVHLSGYYAERMNYILRVYVPDPASVPAGEGVTITLPDLPNPGDIQGYDPQLTAAVVSALEEPLNPPQPLPVIRGPSSGDTVSYTVTFTPERALTTIQLTAIRWPTQGNNGI